MKNLTKEQVDAFAKKNEVFFSPEELDFTYDFVKKNWSTILQNPAMLNLKRYASHYSEENFVKLEKLYKDYSIKYGSYL